FGLIHLRWFAIVSGLPVAAALLLFGVRREQRAAFAKVQSRRPNRVSAPAGVLLVGSLLLVPMAVYGSVIEPDRLDTELISGVRLPQGRLGTSPLRVAVFSDIQMRHVGPHEIDAVERVMSLQADIILVAGDVFQDQPRYSEE